MLNLQSPYRRYKNTVIDQRICNFSGNRNLEELKFSFVTTKKNIYPKIMFIYSKEVSIPLEINLCRSCKIIINFPLYTMEKLNS